jgi:lysozyme
VTAAEITAALCRRFEGFYANPYLCPAGVPTIGFGFTRYLDGTAVTLLDPPMAREAAEDMLVALIERDYMPAVIRLCPELDTEGRLAAITDFAFNLGVNALRTSTLRRKIAAGAWDDEVPAQLRRWTRANGRVLRGLVLRREAEIEYI